LNPYRKFKASPADYLIVASALTVTFALLVWALLG